MAFSPFARVTNFTVKNLKSLLEVYPSMAKELSWGDAYEIIENSKSGFKRSYYQLACQFGLEDKGRENFRIQSYLYTFEDEQLEKYIQFWMKTYYAPNPYVNSNDPTMIIYVEIAKEILAASNHELNYTDFFNRRIAGKSEDILLNAIKSFCSPIKYKRDQERDILFVDENECEFLENEIAMIEKEFPVGNPKDKKEFFDRFTYGNFCKFHGILINIPEPDFSIDKNILGKRLTGGVIGAALIGFGFSFLYHDTGLFVISPHIVFALIGAFGSIISQLGDLTASAIKRNHGIKDYGDIIPGHGGILDRFDSIIFVAPVVYYIILCLARIS